MVAQTRVRLVLIVFLLIVLMTGGIVGYMVIEDWSFLDSVYMTVISLTTVGYGEVHPLTPSGRVFTVFLLLTGLGLVSYSVSLLAQAALEGHIKGIWGRRKMDKEISKLRYHYIICGYGRIGRTIAKAVRNRGLPVVIVENDPEIQQEIEKDGFLYIPGDATHDETLKQAGVERARGVICVLPTDPKNVYATLTARSLNPGLIIVARADDANAEQKMIQAGADKVISPYEIGARRMALAILQPTVTEFLDLAVHATGFNLQIEQIEIKEGSYLDGLSLQQASLRQKTGASVLAVQREDKEMVVSPPPDFVLRAGDIIVALGSAKALQSLNEYASKSGSG